MRNVFSPNTEPLSSLGRKFPALFSQIFPAGLLFIFSKLTTVSKFVRGLPGDPESSLWRRVSSLKDPNLANCSQMWIWTHFSYDILTREQLHTISQAYKFMHLRKYSQFIVSDRRDYKHSCSLLTIVGVWRDRILWTQIRLWHTDPGRKQFIVGSSLVYKVLPPWSLDTEDEAS